MLMLGSNSYLELTTHPKVKERAIEAIRRYGTGCAGSRFLNGTLPIHLELEQRLADLVGKEAALVFSTGYQTNTGVLSCLVQRGEYILSDKLNHACIVDGAQLSAGTMIRYNHNDMRDLERRLAALPAVRRQADRLGRRLLDGRGHLRAPRHGAPGAQVRRAGDARRRPLDRRARSRRGGNRRALRSHRHVDLIMGTFSKSLAAIGGFIASSERVINYLKHHSRPFIFSASRGTASVAAVLAALDIMRDEPERIERLWENARFMKQGLDALGFDTGASQTPVIPIVVGELERCFKVWRWLHDQGIFVNPVVPPAVPPRAHAADGISLTAGHTRQQLGWALDKLAEAGRKFGLFGISAWPPA